MATQRTANLNLVLPFQDEPVAVSDVNNNMTVIDAAANALEDGLAIVSNGNTHPAITSGQFVYIRNHSTLTEGLYRATANISANGALTSSNVAADPNGGLNALNEQIAKRKAFSKASLSIAPGESKQSTLDLPSSYNQILGIIVGADPDTHYNSMLAFRNISIDGTIQYYCVGSGASQTFTFKYYVLYT